MRVVIRERLGRKARNQRGCTDTASDDAPDVRSGKLRIVIPAPAIKGNEDNRRAKIPRALTGEVVCACDEKQKNEGRTCTTHICEYTHKSTAVDSSCERANFGSIRSSRVMEHLNYRSCRLEDFQCGRKTRHVSIFGVEDRITRRTHHVRQIASL